MKNKIIWEEIEKDYEEFLKLFGVKDNEDTSGFLLFLILKELRKIT